MFSWFPVAQAPHLGVLAVRALAIERRGEGMARVYRKYALNNSELD